MPDPHDLLGLAVEAAQAAGAFLLDAVDSVPALVQTKSSRTDMVSEVDRASEELIAGTILAARPGDAFLGEEGTSRPGGGDQGACWIVDPLDGTTNFLYGFPGWAVSIAAEVDDELAVGVVHDPIHDETFTALRGEGSACNGRPLRVDGAAELATALVGTGFSYDAGARARQASELVHILPAVRDVRRMGAAALDLCWVALGRLDLFYERGLQPWDWAAGFLVAAEAGALTTALGDGTRVVAPPQLHAPFLELLATATRL